MLGFYRAFAKLRAYLLRSVGSVAREKTCWRWWQSRRDLQEQSGRAIKGESVSRRGWFICRSKHGGGRNAPSDCLGKCYAKRAAIRGRLQAPTVPTWAQQLLLFDFPMFFQKLVEQHRVHRFVAHGVDPSVLIAHHQVGVYLG